MSKLQHKLHQLVLLKDNLLNDIAQFSTDELNYKFAENEWSITQVITHLIESESGTCKYINYKLKEIDSIPTINFRSTINSIGLNTALKSNKKFRAPKVVSNPPNDLSLEELIKKWGESRVYLSNMVLSFPKEHIKKAIFKHPKAGPISIIQTLAFLTNHLKHHLHQIENIKRELVK